MALSASMFALADGDSLRKAECKLLTGEAEGEGLLEVLAAASSSAGDESTSMGEEGCCLVIGTPLIITFRGLSGQGLDRKSCL